MAKREGVSINQLIASAVSEKISAIMTAEYLEQRGKRAREGAFGRVLDNVPSREPLPGDEIGQQDASGDSWSTPLLGTGATARRYDRSWNQ